MYKYKKIQDLYAENYKMLIDEMTYAYTWKDILCSCIRRLNTVKVSISPS